MRYDIPAEVLKKDPPLREVSPVRIIAPRLTAEEIARLYEAGVMTREEARKAAGLRG